MNEPTDDDVKRDDAPKDEPVTRGPPRRDYLLLRDFVEAQVFRALPEGGYAPPRDLDYVDLIVDTGRQHLARRISGGDTVSSPMRYMAVGTSGVTPILSHSRLLGEVKRKLSAVYSATGLNVYTNTATFGGAADGVTGITLREVGIFNHAGSGAGVMFQRVLMEAITLAGSDLISITLGTNIGSS